MTPNRCDATYAAACTVRYRELTNPPSHCLELYVTQELHPEVFHPGFDGLLSWEKVTRCVHGCPAGRGFHPNPLGPDYQEIGRAELGLSKKREAEVLVCGIETPLCSKSR